MPVQEVQGGTRNTGIKRKPLNNFFKKLITFLFVSQLDQRSPIVRMAVNVQALSLRINLSRCSNLNLCVNKALTTAATTDLELPKNKLENVISAHNQESNGVVYDKKPIRIFLEAGKKYSWCLCGRSHKQPFCDGTHRHNQLKIPQKPIRFAVEESKEYWLCNCKQTANRPFCDGTHKNPTVQEAISIIRQ